MPVLLDRKRLAVDLKALSGPVKVVLTDGQYRARVYLQLLVA
jgi:hypothetical protein